MAARSINPLLKLGLDLGPLLIFFAANALFGIFPATAIFMVAMIVSIAIGITVERKLSPVPLITAALVLIFGGLTLWLADEFFIKIKPTILYTMFAAVLVGGLLSKRLLIKFIMGQSLEMPDAAWRTLTWRWAGFFLALAVANEFVWRTFSTDTWVAFKVWGVFPATLLFALSQTPFMLRHQIEERPRSASQ
jgi:intracellular septation protein